MRVDLFPIPPDRLLAFREQYADLYRRMNLGAGYPGSPFAELELFSWIGYEGIDETRFGFPGERLDVYANLLGWHLVEHHAFAWRSNRPVGGMLHVAHDALAEAVPLHALLYRPLSAEEEDVGLPDPVEVGIASAAALAAGVRQPARDVAWRRVLADVSRRG